jgi:hypothetical protein
VQVLAMDRKTFPRYIVWSKQEIDLSDEWQRRWYIRQVLMYGRAEDVARLDWDEIERLLPELDLPETLHLWESYFHARKADYHCPKSAKDLTSSIHCDNNKPESRKSGG